jgi:hypothetical protein
MSVIFVADDDDVTSTPTIATTTAVLKCDMQQEYRGLEIPVGTKNNFDNNNEAQEEIFRTFQRILRTILLVVVHYLRCISFCWVPYWPGVHVEPCIPPEC